MVSGLKAMLLAGLQTLASGASWWQEAQRGGGENSGVLASAPG